MAEIVLGVIAVVFQDVERFVLDFPSGSATVGEGDDVVLVGFDGGYEMILVGSLAAVLDFHGEPVDLQGIVSVADRQWTSAPLVGAGFSARALGALGVRDLGLALQSLQIVVEGGMG